MSTPFIQLDAREVSSLGGARPLGSRTAMVAVFLILFGSYAYFWQGRDWNSASRLMLVYALGDQGTILINGLEDQTGDKAVYRGRFYTDKQPGYSLLALPVYLAAKVGLGLEPHPLNQPGFAHWPADYWVTLGTSGVFTAGTGALLTGLAIWLGVAPVWAMLPGLGYGIATPAYVYATLAYGHQTTSFLLLAAFLAVAWGAASPRPLGCAFLAGLFSGYACTIELSVAPVGIILGGWVLVRVLGRGWPATALATFLAGGFGPLVLLLTYNFLAYGSAFDMGYAHHAVPRFREVHSNQNPLGLRLPRWELVRPLLLGEYRGLLVYAPVLVLAPLGWLNLRRRGRGALALGSVAICLAIFLVNLSYPEWTGGWCTGPRLLVPLLPFGMMGVMGVLLDTGRDGLNRVLRGLALALVLAGAGVMLLCVGVGGRIPETLFQAPLSQPLSGVVWPLWRGDPIPRWWIGGRFGGNLVATFWPQVNNLQTLSGGWQWVQFLPLVLGQLVSIGTAVWLVRHKAAGAAVVQAVRPPMDA